MNVDRMRDLAVISAFRDSTLSWLAERALSIEVSDGDWPDEIAVVLLFQDYELIWTSQRRWVAPGAALCATAMLHGNETRARRIKGTRKVRRGV